MDMDMDMDMDMHMDMEENISQYDDIPSEISQNAMELTGEGDLRDKPISSVMSGGQIPFLKVPLYNQDGLELYILRSEFTRTHNTE